MAELDEKIYSKLNTKLENMGDGAEEHHADTENPLPPNIVKARYTDAKDAFDIQWGKAKDAQTLANTEFDKYHALLKTTETMVSNDQKLVKGIYGIYNEKLRDYGIKPEKKRPGRKRTTPPTA